MNPVDPTGPSDGESEFSDAAFLRELAELEAAEAEEAERVEEASRRVQATLQKHVRDIAPEHDGKDELIRQMGSSAVGMANVEVQRSDPSLRVDGVVSLERGVSAVLVGRNGAGKSTALDAIMDANGAFMSTRGGDGAYVYNESVHAREFLRIARLNQEDLMEGIEDLPAGVVMRETAEYFRGQFPVDEGGWGDAEIYERNLSNQEAQLRIEQMTGRVAELFEMGEFMQTPAGQLSGGERTKLALYMMLMSEPDVLLLDEPTNHLDLKTVATLTGLFENYRKAGVSILSASHVGWFLEDAGQRVVEVSWKGGERRMRQANSTYRDFAKNPERSLGAVINGELNWLQDDYWYKQGETLVAAPHEFQIPDSPVNSGMPHIHGGDLIVLSGDNGAGKTKLMETILSNRSDALPKRQGGVNVAYLPQFWPEAVAGGTVAEFYDWVRQSANPNGTGAATNRDMHPDKLFNNLVKELQFGGSARVGQEWMRAPFGKFSGGEQRLLWFIAVSSLRDIDMLLLDEPTNHMDQDSQQKVARAIAKFPGAVLMATHDRTLIQDMFGGQDLSGQGRHPDHWVMTKTRGVSRLEQSSTDPARYIEAVTVAARQRARRFVV